jgi:hypothetical protein
MVVLDPGTTVWLPLTDCLYGYSPRLPWLCRYNRGVAWGCISPLIDVLAWGSVNEYKDVYVGC